MEYLIILSGSLGIVALGVAVAIALTLKDKYRHQEQMTLEEKKDAWERIATAIGVTSGINALAGFLVIIAKAAQDLPFLPWLIPAVVGLTGIYLAGKIDGYIAIWTSNK